MLRNHYLQSLAEHTEGFSTTGAFSMQVIDLYIRYYCNRLLFVRALSMTLHTIDKLAALFLYLEFVDRNWMLKDCYGSAGLGDPERLKMKGELRRQSGEMM